MRVRSDDEDDFVTVDLVESPETSSTPVETQEPRTEPPETRSTSVETQGPRPENIDDLIRARMSEFFGTFEIRLDDIRHVNDSLRTENSRLQTKLATTLQEHDRSKQLLQDQGHQFSQLITTKNNRAAEILVKMEKELSDRDRDREEKIHEANRAAEILAKMEKELSDRDRDREEKIHEANRMAEILAKMEKELSDREEKIQEVVDASNAQQRDLLEEMETRLEKVHADHQEKIKYLTDSAGNLLSNTVNEYEGQLAQARDRVRFTELDINAKEKELLVQNMMMQTLHARVSSDPTSIFVAQFAERSVMNGSMWHTSVMRWEDAESVATAVQLIVKCAHFRTQKFYHNVVKEKEREMSVLDRYSETSAWKTMGDHVIAGVVLGGFFWLCTLPVAIEGGVAILYGIAAGCGVDVGIRGVHSAIGTSKRLPALEDQRRYLEIKMKNLMIRQQLLVRQQRRLEPCPDNRGNVGDSPRYAFEMIRDNRIFRREILPRIRSNVE